MRFWFTIQLNFQVFFPPGFPGKGELEEKEKEEEEEEEWWSFKSWRRIWIEIGEDEEEIGLLLLLLLLQRLRNSGMLD